MKLDLIKNEKGSITVYVLIAMLFILAIVFGRYLLANRQLQTQITAAKQVKTIYESNVKEYDNVSVTTNPTLIPGPTSSSGPNTTIEIGQNPIPIYNYEALKYFLDGGRGPYYVYQEQKNYYGGVNATFKLCFDITIPEAKVVIISTTNSVNSFQPKYELLNTMDFGNHVIYSNDGYRIFKNSNGTLKCVR